MKKTALSIALTLSLSLISFESQAINSVFDGTTSDINTNKYERTVKFTDKDTNGKEIKIDDQVLDIAKFFDMKVEKNDKGEPEFSLNKDKANALFKMSSPLNVGMLYALEGKKNGNLMFVSENHRYYFVGNMYDLFSNMRKVDSIDDMRDFATRVFYKKWGIDPNTLNSVSIGNGKEEVVIWVLANDPLTSKIIKQASDLSKKEKKYKFYFVVTPNFFTEDSYNLAKKFYCARENGNNEIGDLLYTNRLDELEEIPCDLSGLEKTMAVKYITGVDKAPFIVANDGRVSAGIPENGLEDFLTVDPTVKLKWDKNNPEELNMKKALEKKIVEQAMFDDLDDDVKNQARAQKQADNLSLKAPNEDFTELRKAEIKKIKDNYKPQLDKIERLQKYEDLNYQHERTRIQRALDSTVKYDQNNPNQQQDIQSYQSKLNQIDADYNSNKTKLQQQYNTLKKQQQDEIDKVVNAQKEAQEQN